MTAAFSTFGEKIAARPAFLRLFSLGTLLVAGLIDWIAGGLFIGWSLLVTRRRVDSPAAPPVLKGPFLAALFLPTNIRLLLDLWHLSLAMTAIRSRLTSLRMMLSTLLLDTLRSGNMVFAAATVAAAPLPLISFPLRKRGSGCQ